jgi:uncharacterized protein YyaL (SSP411 family)
MRIDGTLYHQKLWGKKLKVVVLFEDYAFLIDAFVDAYEVNYDGSYITLAQTLTKEAIDKFYDAGSWYLSDDAYRTKTSLYDSAYASPAAVMTRALFKLSLQTDDLTLYEVASKSVSQNPQLLQQYPNSVASLFDTFIGYKIEYKVLKSTKENLRKNSTKIQALHSPYLLTRAIELDETLYQGCTMKACFATDKKLEKVLGKIKQR